MKKKVIISLIILGLLAYGSPFVAGYLHEEPLTEEIRTALSPGKTLKIEDGVIHYVERGPADGPVIVMVHGFATPHFIFDQNARALEEAGYRVIQFDHFGRGWSDRPSTVYDAAFYKRELLQILQGLEIKEPVGLVGLSMGGAIVTEFLADHPAKVSGAFLLVSAGLANSRDPESLADRMIMTPVLGEWLWRLSARTTLLKGRAERAKELAAPNRLQGDIAVQMKYRGFFRALLSTYRNFPLRDRDESFVRANATGVPFMAVFGDADQIIPLESVDRFRSLLPTARTLVINGGTHGLNHENFEAVSPLMIDFFASLPVRSE